VDWTPFQWWILPKYFILDESPYGLWGGQKSIAKVLEGLLKVNLKATDSEITRNRICKLSSMSSDGHPVVTNLLLCLFLFKFAICRLYTYLKNITVVTFFAQINCSHVHEVVLSDNLLSLGIPVHYVPSWYYVLQSLWEEICK
jgi:hypothetical protein